MNNDCSSSRRGKLILANVERPLANFYRTYLGRRGGHKLWVVDGGAVEAYIYPEFCYGGNDQRYLFNPRGEIWLDNRCGIEEIEYTVRHELIEREHMERLRWTYERAHGQALAWEKIARVREQKQLAARRRQIVSQGKVNRFDPQAVAQSYVGLVGTRQGARVWIVDGSHIRRSVEQNFCFGGFAGYWDFIPPGEIWLEAALNAEHAYYVQFQMLRHWQLCQNGMRSDLAYDQAMEERCGEYLRQAELARAHERQVQAVRYGARDRGVRRRRRA